MNHHFNCHVFPVAAACLGVAALTRLAYADVPAATQPVRSHEQVNADYQNALRQLQKATSGRDFAKADDRNAMTPEAVPALQKLVAALDEMKAGMPSKSLGFDNQKGQFQSLLYALGDEATVLQTNSLAKVQESTQGRAARMVQLQSDWFRTADQDAAGRAAVVHAIQMLDSAHPDDELLTLATFALYQRATDPAQKVELEGLLTGTMKNKVSTQVAGYLKTAAAHQHEAQLAAEKLKGLENKPLVVAGTTVDGPAFSTERWKGKVVLVDFWATWCGPCKAELPRVKNLYAQYHDKGLEILGVSNDYAAQLLKTFTADNKMPWPELFDAKAADDQQWNPITLGYGIEGIPQVFLIDKKGILRTVNARETMEDMIPKLLEE